MRLGFAVKVLSDGGLPSHDARRWQSGPSLGVSLDRLEAVLRFCAEHDLLLVSALVEILVVERD